MANEVKSDKSLYIILIIVISSIIFVIALIILFLLISNPSITLSFNDLQTGKKLELRQSSVVKFSISETAHELSLDKVAGSYVNITIQSSTIKSSLKVGETKTFDLTDNEISEFEIKLVSIIAGKATLSLKELSDSPPPCVEDWTCSSWTSCSNGTQTRTCLDLNSCGTTSSKPPLSQQCCSSSCTVWSNCSSSSIQTRTCSSQGNCSTAQIPTLNQSCTYASSNCSIYESYINSSCVKKNCSDIGGMQCPSNYNCAGVQVNSSDVSQCCINNTITSTRCSYAACAQIGGTKCNYDQNCTGSLVYAYDTSSCCLNGTCNNINCSSYNLNKCSGPNICSGKNTYIGSASCCNGTCMNYSCGQALAKTTADIMITAIRTNDIDLFNLATDYNKTYLPSVIQEILDRYTKDLENYTYVSYDRYEESIYSTVYYSATKIQANDTVISLGIFSNGTRCLVLVSDKDIYINIYQKNNYLLDYSLSTKSSNFPF